MLSFMNCKYLFIFILNYFVLICSLDALKSEIKYCQSFNFEVLTCYWDVYNVNHKRIPLDLYYKKGDSKRFRTNFAKCNRTDHEDSNSTTNWCQLSYKTHQIIHIPITFVLNSSDSTLVSDSDPLYIDDLNKIYKPGVTQGISVANTSSRTTHINWSPPNKKPHLYNILYYRTGDNNHSLNTTENSIHLSALLPHSHYHLSIRSILHIQNSILGSWSEWTRSQFETLEDVPSASPLMFEGGFKRLSSNQLKVIWEELSEKLKNGKITKTRIRIINECDVSSSLFRKVRMNGLKDEEYYDFKAEMSEEVETSGGIEGVNVLVAGEIHTGDVSSVTELPGEWSDVVLQMDDVCTHLVLVDMATSRGFNRSLSVMPLYIPSKYIMPKGILPLSTNASVRNYGDFTVDWETVPRSHAYRLIYWSDSFNKSTNYSSDVTSNPPIHVHLPYTANKAWRFSISTQYLTDDNDTLSSGMVEVACVYNLSRNYPFQSLNVQHRTTKCSVSLEWTPPDCSNQYPSYFSHYAISFCPTDQFQNCQEVKVERWETSHTIEQLQCGQAYHVNFSLVTDNHTLNRHEIEVTIPSGTNPWIWIVSSIFVLIMLSSIAFLLSIKIRQLNKPIPVSPLPVLYSKNEFEHDVEYS